MQKFYVASSFRNIGAVNDVAHALIGAGWVQTYDWSRNAKAHDDNTFPLEELSEIARLERQGVLDADVVVILLPGGKGTHVELGLALGNAKRIVLHSPDRGALDPAQTSTFYHLPEVERCFGDLDELLDVILSRTTDSRAPEQRPTTTSR